MTQINTLSQLEKYILNRCRNSIHELDADAVVILYGSRARGDSTENSDFDILILVNREVSLKEEDQYRRQTYPIELETGYVLTVQVFSKKQWNSRLFQAMPFHENVTKEGVLL